MFVLFSLVFSSEAFAARARFEDFSGVDHRFDTGYSYRKYADSVHEAATYDLVVPDAEKDKDAQNALVDEEKNIDEWRYQRDFNYAATYRSNIMGVRNDPRGDIIHNYAGVFGMTRRGKRNFVEMFYNLGYSHQVENEKATALSKSQVTTIGFTLGRLNLTASNTFSPSAAMAAGERTELETATSKRVTAITDTLAVDSNYKVGEKTRAGFSYARNIFYLPVASNSATINSFSTISTTYIPRLSYAITPKLSISAQYAWLFTEFFQGGTLGSKSQTPAISLTGRLTPKLSFSGQVSYVSLQYADSQIPDANNPTFQFSLTRKLTEKIAGTLSTTRSTTENFDSLTGSIQQNSTYYGVDLTWNVRPRLSFDFGGSVGFQSSDGLLVTAVDPDNPTLTFTRAMETQNYEWGGTLQWAVRRYASALIGYQRLNNNGSFKGGEFDEHRILSSVNAKF